MTLSKYNEIMDKIEVTEDMRQRVLKNVEKECKNANNIIQFPSRNKKKYASLVGIAAVAAVCIIAGKGIIGNTPTVPDNPEGDVMIHGPVEAGSAQELSNNVGFEISDIKALADKADEIYYSSIGDIAEIMYSTADNTISYRKAPGSDDISGDYNTYATIVEKEFDNTNVTIKGNKDENNVDKFFNATWTKDGYSYSLTFENGVDLTEIEEIINSTAW